MGTASSQYAFAEGLTAIRSGPVTLEDTATWKKIFESGDVTPHEVASIVDVPIIRELRRDRPAQLAMLIFKSIHVLMDFIKAAEVSPKGANGSMARNALLLLGRVVPIALEPLPADPPTSPAPPAAGSQAAATPPPSPPHPKAANFAENFFVKCLRCEDDESTFPALEPNLTVGQSLVNAILACGVAPGFAIGSSQTPRTPHKTHTDVDAARLWAGPIAAVNSAPRHTDGNITFTNRLCVMRALLGCLASQVYRPQVLVRDHLRSHLLSAATPHAVTLCASLLGQVSDYVPTGILPYTSHWVSSAENCVHHAAELLVLLLDYTDFYPAHVAKSTEVIAGSEPAAPEEGKAKAAGRPPAGEENSSLARSTDVPSSEAGDDNSRDERDALESDSSPRHQDPEQLQPPATRARPPPPAASSSSAAFQPDLRRHAFWGLLNRLSPMEAEALMRGLVGLLANTVEARNTYLPNSQRLMPGYEFYFALFWVLVEKCPSLRAVLARDKTSAQRLLLPLLNFTVMGDKLDGRLPQIQLGVSAIACLSLERRWLVNLNAPFAQWIPYELEPFTGTYSDLLVITLHTLALKKKAQGQRNMIYSILNNVVPYMTSMSAITASKLANLLQQNVTPAWLTANPLHPHLLPRLVTAIASVIHYQPGAGCASLLYAILRQRKIATDLEAAALKAAEYGLPPGYVRDPHVQTLLCAVRGADAELGELLRYEPDADPFELLKARVTLVGCIPPPPPLQFQHFLPSSSCDAWRTSWLWSMVFAYNYPHILSPDSVRIFNLAPRRFG